MSETSHSPEPWHFGNDYGNCGAIVDCGPDCEFIYSGDPSVVDRYFEDMPEDEQWANARRIVACVNACRGIPTEKLARIQFYEYDENWPVHFTDGKTEYVPVEITGMPCGVAPPEFDPTIPLLLTTDDIKEPPCSPAEPS